LRDLIVTAPQSLCDRLAGLPTVERVVVVARLRPGDLSGPAEAAKVAMATVARRYQMLTAEIDQLDGQLDRLVWHTAPPRLLAKQGVATPGRRRIAGRCG
jgi:transposase